MKIFGEILAWLMLISTIATVALIVYMRSFEAFFDNTNLLVLFIATAVLTVIGGAMLYGGLIADKFGTDSQTYDGLMQTSLPARIILFVLGIVGIPFGLVLFVITLFQS